MNLTPIWLRHDLFFPKERSVDVIMSKLSALTDHNDQHKPDLPKPLWLKPLCTE